MKVFISWSGARSRAIANLLDIWIKCVIQAVDPWMSSKDIDRGSLWFSEINDQLKDTNVGIVCLTRDNKNSPWILFESGALAKGLSSNRVCTLLIDLSPTDIANPLAQFNHTSLDRDGIFQLVRTINISLNEKGLENDILEKVFETYWPQLEASIETALSENPPKEDQNTPVRDENEILHEILGTIRSLDRRMRHIESPSKTNLDSGGLLSLKEWIDNDNERKKAATGLLAAALSKDEIFEADKKSFENFEKILKYKNQSKHPDRNSDDSA